MKTRTRILAFIVVCGGAGGLLGVSDSWDDGLLASCSTELANR